MAYKNITLDQLMNGINQTESSGRYNVIGPATKKGNHAYGISQVMDFNVGPWSQQYFGQRLTPEQFLNNKEAQIAVTKGKLGELYNKYGNPADVASAWFSGQPLARAGNASDGFKNVPQYVNDVLNAAQKQDPNAMMALAPEDQPQAPQGAQSISLGDQENQQPLNNIGSTLANMGASIASLDRGGTGIASLNASRVASNLASQEQAREAQGGWKYAGQTQNGQGLMFQNSRGEIRVEPLAPGFSGQKEPETIRTLRMLADPANKALLDTKKELTGNTEQSNFDEDGNWKYETSKEDIDTLIKRAAAGEGNDVLKGQTKKTRADFNHRTTELGIAPETFAAGKAAQSGLLQQSREFGRRQGILEIAVPKLQTDISVARDLLQQYKKENPNGSWKGWNWLKNAGTEEFTGPGAQTLAKLKETFKTLTDQFATVQQNGQLTEASRQQASKLINENMDTGVAEAVLDNMQSLGVRSLDSIRKARENHIARTMKQPIPYPELEVDPEANKSASKGKPTIGGANKAPSNIRNPNDLMNWIQSQGLRKGDKFTLPDGSEGTVP
jgi:hypothetical protein